MLFRSICSHSIFSIVEFLLISY
ncbi:unnamed protein product [Victoria cruziana]